MSSDLCMLLTWPLHRMPQTEKMRSAKACEAGTQIVSHLQGPEGGCGLFATGTTTHGAWLIQVAAFMQQSPGGLQIAVYYQS